MRFLTIREAAKLCKVSEKTIRRNLNEIPHIKIGRQIRIDAGRLHNEKEIQNQT